MIVRHDRIRSCECGERGCVAGLDVALPDVYDLRWLLPRAGLVWRTKVGVRSPQDPRTNVPRQT